MGYQSRQWGIGILLAVGVACDLYGLRTGIDIKLFWAYLSIALTIAGYALYISQMYPSEGEKAVKPEPLTWALFGLLTAIGWIVQVAQGAKAGSWCLGVTAGACFLVAGKSYLRFKWAFGFEHALIAATAIVLFAFSLMTRNNFELATLSAVLATFADFVSYFPTFKKATLHPYEESVTNFAFNSLKCIPALLAVELYSVATTVYLLMLLVVNGGFAFFLLIKRSRLSKE